MPMRAILEQLTGDPQTVPALARSLYVTRQGVQAFVDQAKALGYVETLPNPAHQRSHLIALTEAGRDAFARIHDGELANLDAIADGLTADDIEVCVRVLDHLLGGIDGLLTAQTRSSNTSGTSSDALGYRQPAPSQPAPATKEMR